MSKLLTSALVVLTSGLFDNQATAQTCSVTPDTVSDFSAESFAGNWHMQASTFYSNDEFGCIKFTASEPNDSGKIDAGLRMV